MRRPAFSRALQEDGHVARRESDRVADLNADNQRRHFQQGLRPGNLRQTGLGENRDDGKNAGRDKNEDFEESSKDRPEKDPSNDYNSHFDASQMTYLLLFFFLDVLLFG
jgi:hypothetical protein